MNKKKTIKPRSAKEILTLTMREHDASTSLRARSALRAGGPGGDTSKCFESNIIVDIGGLLPPH